MSRTITALFDQRSDAEAAQERLKQSNVGAGRIAIHDKSSSGYKDDGYSTTRDPGLWASIKNAFLPDEDRHTYEEGVRRGGFLLTADVDEDHVDAVVRVLEEADTVDIDDRAQQWRSSGWDYAPVAGAGAGAFAYGAEEGAIGGNDGGGGALRGGDDADTEASAYATGHMAVGDSISGATGEQVIPIVEQELVVGEREVDRGGSRVRSYVTTVPVHEQVRPRDERIAIDRDPGVADDSGTGYRS